MSRFQLQCVRCDREQSHASLRCLACGGVLSTCYSHVQSVDSEQYPARKGIWRHAALLPVNDLANSISLGEGDTPIVESARIGPSAGLNHLLFKNESGNPTGSYKDRIAAVAISLARERGRVGWVATSSGNAGAALAAYGARAELSGVLIVPANASPAKLAQIRAYQPHIVAVEGFSQRSAVDDAVFECLARAGDAFDLELSITAHAFSPLAMDGAKTIAFEIVESHPAGVDRIYVPVGGGGLASAIIRGFMEYQQLGLVIRIPTVVVAQAEGCAPVVDAFARDTAMRPVETVTTTISGVQLGNPPDGEYLLELLRRTGGSATAVSDVQIYDAQARLAREEGLFVEPAGALSVAAALSDRSAGRIERDETVLCLLTGSGFKVREAVDQMAVADLPLEPVDVGELEARLESIAKR